jgi:hypothetical protein
MEEPPVPIGPSVITVPAGSILVLRTSSGSTVDLLNLTAAHVDAEHTLDVLVMSEAGDSATGTAELPTPDGLVRLPAKLDREQGELHLRLPSPVRPLQRRLAPRSGLVLPLRGAAQLSLPGAEATGPGQLVTFHGHTIDVGAGGLQAKLIADAGVRLPQHLRSVFVELDPDDPNSVAVGLHVVTFRSDVLRARFSFISLADWTRLRERTRDSD